MLVERSTGTLKDLARTRNPTVESSANQDSYNPSSKGRYSMMMMYITRFLIYFLY